MGSEGHYNPDADAGPTFNLSGSVVFAVIAFIFIVIFFVLCLNVCVCCFQQRSIRSFGRRGGSSRRRRFAFTGDRDVARLQRVGLERSVIESFPVFVYQSANHKDGLECAVCLSEFEEMEKGRLLPKCNHSFHIDCIDMWLHSHSTCPLCRASARPDAPSAVTVGVVVAGESSATSSATVEEASSSVPVDGNPSEQRGGGETPSGTGDNGPCASCRRNDGLPSPTYPTNTLFWGSQNQMNSSSISSKLHQGTSSRKPSEKIVIDIPRRKDSFSSPRLISGDERQTYSPGGPSAKSPITRLRSLKLLLGRDKMVIAQGTDGVDVEQGGQAKC